MIHEQLDGRAVLALLRLRIVLDPLLIKLDQEQRLVPDGIEQVVVADQVEHVRLPKTQVVRQSACWLVAADVQLGKHLEQHWVVLRRAQLALDGRHHLIAVVHVCRPGLDRAQEFLSSSAVRPDKSPTVLSFSSKWFSTIS